jgi:hypothetical protein
MVNSYSKMAPLRILLATESYDYSPEHMLEGIGESVSWVAGVLRE